jgi:hypothetical protein
MTDNDSFNDRDEMLGAGTFVLGSLFGFATRLQGTADIAGPTDQLPWRAIVGLATSRFSDAVAFGIVFGLATGVLALLVSHALHQGGSHPLTLAGHRR